MCSVHAVSDYKEMLCHGFFLVRMWFGLRETQTLIHTDFVHVNDECRNSMYVCVEVCVRAQFHILCAVYSVIKFQNQIVHLWCLSVSFQRQLKIITMICGMQIYICQITSSGCKCWMRLDRVTETNFFLSLLPSPSSPSYFALSVFVSKSIIREYSFTIAMTLITSDLHWMAFIFIELLRSVTRTRLSKY